jgi:hypothetical protein
MNLIRNPYIKKAVQSLAKAFESNRLYLEPYISLLGQKTPLRIGRRVAHQGELHCQEVEVLAKINLLAVAPALGYRIRSGKLPQLRQAFQTCFERLHDVSLEKQITPAQRRQRQRQKEKAE